MNVFDLIKKCAQSPSFSSYEERIHSIIYEVCATTSAQISHVKDNNLFIYVPGKKNVPPVALTAHLDKINHWGESYPLSLPCRIESSKIVGQMDDAAGLGICLFMIFESMKYSFPPLFILLSEMEESTGFNIHPHLLKNKEDLYPGVGAIRLAEHLLGSKQLPSCVITIDTTPEFQEQPGIAFYDRFWHMHPYFVPSSDLLEKTTKMKQFFLEANPSILESNANNDYIEYGFTLNKNHCIPSVALEPAIYPYHQAEESVYCSDILQIVDVLKNFLQKFTF